MAMWWLITLIMCTLYKASLLSAMIYPPNNEPDDLEQLVNAQFKFAGNLLYKDIMLDLFNNSDATYKYALQNTIYGNDNCDALSKVFNGGVALLDEVSEIQFELREMCPQMKNIDKDYFRVTRKPVRHAGHAWPLQLDAPYRSAFNYYFSLILSGGLFKKWIEDETVQFRSSLFHRSREYKADHFQSLSFERLIPLLCIYLFGIGTACLCFLIEIFTSKYEQSNYRWHIIKF